MSNSSPLPDKPQDVSEAPKKLWVAFIHFVRHPTWPRGSVSTGLFQNLLGFFPELELNSILMLAGSIRVLMPHKVLLSVGVTVGDLEVVVYFFLGAGEMSTALLPKQNNFSNFC